MKNITKKFQLAKVESGLSKLPPPSINLMSMLNPLGAISDVVGSILSYKKGIKEIEYQMLQVKEQAALMHDKIEAEKNIALKKLEAQKFHITQYLEITRSTLREASSERNKVLSIMSNISKAILKEEISSGEKEEYRETINILSEVIIESGKQSMRNFNTAIEHISGQLTISTDINPILLSK
jgi:hypothetical protein